MKKFQVLILYIIVNTVQMQAQAPTTWVSKGIGGGGALFSPSINPDNSNEMYIACDMGGLYNSKNQGVNWQIQNYTQIRSGMYSKVNFTNNTNIRYALHYTANGIQDQIVPVKTTDGGLTWNKLVGNPDDNAELFSLHANYDNPNQVLINQYNAIYFSNDGGTTFPIVITGNNIAAGIKIGGVHWDANNIYIATNVGIIRSINGGASFSNWATTGIPADQVISSFASAKEGTITRFYAMTSNINDVYNGDDFDVYQYMKGIYSMDNTSGTWVNKLSNADTNTQFGKVLRMAKNKIDVVYIAGQTDIGNPLVLKTTNNGTLWNAVFNTTNNQNIYTAWCGASGDVNWSWAEVFFGMDVCAKDVNVLTVSDYGFIHKSVDGGATWHQSYTAPADEHSSTMLTPQKKIYHSAGDINQISVWQTFWIDSNTLWANSSDIKGTISKDKGNSWSFDYTGHTENTSYRMAKNITNNTLYMATSSVHDLYQSTRLANAQLDASSNTGAVKFSTDNGTTWQVMKDFSDIVCWVSTDPTNSNTLYASVVNSSNGNGGVWKTTNANLGASSTWVKLPNPPRTEGHPFNIIVLQDGNVLASYSGHRNPGFTASSGVFLYNTATNTWADKSHTGMYYWTQDVIVDPHDALQNTWYACVYEGWGVAASQGVGGLYKTTDRGTSWTKIYVNERCMSATISPTNANEIYVTSEYYGLQYCANLSTSTPTFTATNFPFRNTARVFYNPYKQDEIWVCSFGQGMMVGNKTNTSTKNIIANTIEMQIAPNPATNNIRIALSRKDNYDIKIVTMLGETVYTQRYKNTNEINIAVASYAKGMYMVVVENKTEKNMQKCVIE